MLGGVGLESTQPVFSDHFSGGSVVNISSELAASVQMSPWSGVAKHRGVCLECTLDVVDCCCCLSG